MKKLFNYSAIIFLGLLFLNACSKSSDQPEQKMTPTTPAAVTSAEAKPDAAGFTGQVIETMSTAGYTYVQVDTGNKKIWAAAPEFKVSEGETVTVPRGAPMKDYQSKTLNRTFDVVWFVPYIKSGEDSGEMNVSQTAIPETKKTQTCAVPQGTADFSNITKPAGAKTIAEIFKQKTALSGKNIAVCGKVVKYNAEIMGTNWIHIQDGTGENGTNDLTLTTKSTAKIGDTITAKGVLVLDKDFGYGYKYDIIIENAEITVN